MANTQIAALIAERLPTGIIHPGHPEANQPPVPLALPGFGTTGMAPEQAQSINATAQLVGEAIVSLIETDGDTALIPNSELADLKAADETGGATPVTCQECGQPVFYLTAKGTRLTVNKAGMQALARVKHTCEAN